MALTGKVETEVEVHSSAAEFFNVFVTQLHNVENISDEIHEGKLHQGDWHNVGSDSVKHWTYTLRGKVVTCKENFEEIDHQKKSFTINLFDGDVGELYKSLKVKLHVVDDKGNNNSNGALAKWVFEYEKLHQDIPPPEPYLDYITKVTKNVDAHLLKT